MDKNYKNEDHKAELERIILQEKLGKRLRTVLKASKIKQSTFANKCGLSYETLRTHLKGDSFYRVNVLIQAAKECNVSYEYLLCEDEPQEKNDAKPLPDILRNATKLSDDSIDKLINMGANYETRKHDRELIDCLDTLIMSPGVLEKIAVYMRFLKTKNQWRYTEETLDIERKVSASLKQASTIPESSELLNTIDLENILLYQVMKGIDSSIKRSKKHHKKGQ